MPSRGADIVAVTSTTESPYRTSTAPSAWRARWPVAMDSVRPPTSTATWPVLTSVTIQASSRHLRRTRPAARAPPAAGSDGPPTALTAQPEPLDDRAVSRELVGAQIGQKPAPLAHHFEQASAGVEVLLVEAQVLAEMVDTLGQS